MSQEYSFTLPFNDFDLDLIGLDSTELGTPSFTEKVSQFFADRFAQFGGKARVIVNDSDRVIEVRWTKGANWQAPKDKVLELLNAGKIAEAVPMIWTLVKEEPQDSDNLYNLGVSYSELGELSQSDFNPGATRSHRSGSCSWIGCLGRRTDSKQQASIR